MVTLLLTEKGGETKHLVFEKDEVTIGRVQGNDVVLPKGNVSKRHCRILLQSGQFSIEDLKSTNGTYLNGRKIAEPTAVSPADKIYVGDFVIKLEEAAEEAAAAPPGLPEAGSLSTALPRRPPPPPPAPGRSTSSMRSMDDEGLEGARGSAKISLPPPPPPARRDSGAIPLGQSGFGDVAAQQSALDSALDSDGMAARPRLPVPPLKSPRPLLGDEAEMGDLDEAETRHRSSPGGLAHAGSGVGFARQGEQLAGWLGDLMSDGVTAVYIVGPRVEVLRHGRRQPAELPHGVSVADAVRALASQGSPRPSGDTRVVNVLLPQNARLAAIFPPVANELCVTLERVAAPGGTLTELVRNGALPQEAKDLLESSVATRRNILLSGDARALESLLRSVAATISAGSRVVSLAPGLGSAQGADWVKLATDTRVSDIVMAAASLRPDFLVVEVTAPPLATDVLSQCVLGQEGTIVAMAGRSSADALGRLAALAAPALGGLGHARNLAGAAFDLIVCAGTLADGSVRMLDLAEPRPGQGGETEVVPILVWSPDGASGGRYEVVGRPVRLAATLASRGLPVPGSLSHA